MPFHLELGSEGHSFGGKAIVVNSKTGEHKTKAPLPLELAQAQKKALERKEAPPAPKAKKELHEDYKGPRNKDGTPKKSTKAWGMYVREKDKPKPEMMKSKHEGMREEIPEREEEGVKEVKAKEKKVESKADILNLLWEGVPVEGNAIKIKSNSSDAAIVEAIASSDPLYATLTYTITPYNGGKLVKPKGRSYQEERLFQVNYNRKEWVAFNDGNGDKYTAAEVERWKPRPDEDSEPKAVAPKKKLMSSLDVIKMKKKKADKK